MSSKDMSHNSNLATSVAMGVKNSATTGTGFHRGTVAGGPYLGATVFVKVGTVTDGTHVPAIMESDDGTTYTAVAFTDLIIPDSNNAPKDANGNYTAAFANLATNTDQKVDYIGVKPYIRVDGADSGATGAAWAAHILFHHPRHSPV